MSLGFIIILGIILAIFGAILLTYSLIQKFRNKKSLKSMILGIICLVVGLFFVSILFGLNIESYIVVQEITAEEITTDPDDFYNMSEEEIQSFPSLQKAIQSPGSGIETTREEYRAIVDLISEHGSIIKYQEKFYQLAVSS